MIALTKNNDGVWSADGITLPEHVCGYALGIYFEVNRRRNEILLEFYKFGMKFLDSIISIPEI